MTTVYLSLGSNLGSREENIARAIDALGSRGVRVTRQSSMYETEPVEVTDQPWFLNCVIEAETELEPAALMHVLLSIEREMGRERVVPKGPRLIDMDILLYASQVIHDHDLEIPHPRMAQRKFVLAPLVEIAPDAVHPTLDRTAQDLLQSISDAGEVKKMGE